jgi:hypothetical protein
MEGVHVGWQVRGVHVSQYRCMPRRHRASDPAVF